MLGAPERAFEQGDIFKYRATPAVTRGLGFSGLIRRMSRPHSVACYDSQGDVEELFLPGSSRVTAYIEVLIKEVMPRL
jgi:hypothetical protein